MVWEVEVVSLDQAKQHLRLPDTSDQDDDLTIKLAQAHGLVLDYIARPTDTDWQTEMEAWDEDTAPRAVQAAVLRQFGDLVRFRGDDEDTSKVDGLNISPRVKQLLIRYMSHVIA